MQIEKEATNVLFRIDFSKLKHDCAVVDELGYVVTPPWSFNDDCEGISLLKQLLVSLDGDKKIGFEFIGNDGQKPEAVS